MYKIILFDLDDTLLDFKQAEKNGLQHIHREYYQNFSYEEFENAFREINRSLWKRVESKTNPLPPRDVGHLRFVELHQRFKFDLDPALVAKAYESIMSEADWLPGVKESILFLHSKQYTLGIITNGITHIQRRKFERHELAHWFQCFIISDEVNYAKPQEAIFTLALNQINTSTGMSISPYERQSILMVGDSLSSDGYGAKNSGMHFCFVSNNMLEVKQNKVPIHHHVFSVAELPHRLGYEKEYQAFILNNN